MRSKGRGLSEDGRQETWIGVHPRPLGGTRQRSFLKTHPYTKPRNVQTLTLLTISPFQYSAISPFQYSAISPFQYLTISPFQYSAISPFQYSAISPFQYLTLSPFQYLTISPFQYLTLSVFISFQYLNPFTL